MISNSLSILRLNCEIIIYIVSFSRTEERKQHDHDTPDVEGHLRSQGLIWGRCRGRVDCSAHTKCDVAVLQQDGHLWRDDGRGEVLCIVDLFAKGARTIEVRDSPLAIGQADAVEELVGAGKE